MYADVITESMRHAIEETTRRREVQEAYNQEHNITPKTIQKSVKDLISISKTHKENYLETNLECMSREKLKKLIEKIQNQMKAAAADLNFESAAKLRDKMIELKKNLEELWEH